ncbi:MAG: hypothetical protein ACM3VY_00115, partial [Candidatus Bathyarchaeota archaeon]
MPTVPRYQRQVESIGLPTPQLTGTTPEAMGAGIGRGLGAVAEVLHQEEEKANAVQVLDHDDQLQRWKLKALYDEKTGALNQRGENAFGLPERLAADFDRTVMELSKGLANERQKQAFSKLAKDHRNSFLTKINQHVSGELKNHAETKHQAYMETTLNA